MKENKFFNVNLADMRDMVNRYDLVSLRQAIYDLNDKLVLGEVVATQAVSGVVQLAHVSHKLDNFQIVDDMIIGDVEILDTAAGKLVSKNLISGGKLICGFMMVSYIDKFEGDNNRVNEVVTFHISPNQPVIARSVQLASAGILGNTGFTRTKDENSAKKSCGNCDKCKCDTRHDESDDLLTNLMVYHTITEPTRTIYNIDVGNVSQEEAHEIIDQFKCVVPPTDNEKPQQDCATPIVEETKVIVAPTYSEPTYTAPTYTESSYSRSGYSSDSGSGYSSGYGSSDSGSSDSGSSSYD